MIVQSVLGSKKNSHVLTIRPDDNVPESSNFSGSPASGQ